MHEYPYLYRLASVGRVASVPVQRREKRAVEAVCAQWQHPLLTISQVLEAASVRSYTVSWQLLHCSTAHAAAGM